MKADSHGNPKRHIGGGIGSFGRALDPRGLVAAATLALALAACGRPAPPAPAAPAVTGPLTIGVLLDYSGALRNLGLPTENGIRLAIDQVNRAGGVLGQDVLLVSRDGATDPAVSVEAARALVRDEKVHAIIGPLGSAAALAVAKAVTITAKVPIISPTATTPQLTTLDDDGFVFRAVASDSAQGPVLAGLVSDQGLDRVSVLYREDPYGRGLYSAFAKAFGGEIAAAVAIAPNRDTYLAELRQAAAGGIKTLVAISFVPEAEIYLREALDEKLFDQYFLADALAHQYLADTIGVELSGTKGTLPTRVQTDEAIRWTAVYNGEFSDSGAPVEGSSRTAYDAVLCLCLAAEHAGSTTGTAIRDSLPAVCGGDGEVIKASGEEQVALALTAVRAGQAINLDGVASSMDWNRHGDVATGRIATWEIIDGTVTLTGDVAFTMEDGPVQADGGR